MSSHLQRRTFLKAGTATALAATLPASAQRGESEPLKPVGIGSIGLGRRGTGLLQLLLAMPGVKVRAVCDLDADKARHGQDLAEQAGQRRPEAYTAGPDDYKRLLARDDIDAVIIATPWELHTPMSIAAMKAGKYAGVEVPCAVTLEQCWELVNTHEATGIPCMMLENWSFRRDNLAVLNMIRQGLFGEMVHCHCAHSHDCVDHWFWDRDGSVRWPAKYLIHSNRDQYPTHSLGPVLSWLDINVGDAFATLTSTATASKGINAYFARKFGPDDPRAKAVYAQGDIVTTVVKTHGGKTIVINYDMQLPRPYDNRWMAQGTLGVYDEDQKSVYILDRSPEYHKWEPFAPYQEQYEHPWWKELLQSGRQLGHGGTDTLELELFAKAVRDRTETPIDVYDSVTMSVIGPLSEMSIAKDSAPVECPDFTRGKWKTRKPTFAVV